MLPPHRSSSLKSNSLKSNSLKSGSYSHPSTNKSSGYGGSADIYGSKCMLPLNYGGLGYRIFEQLGIEPDKVLQVDATNNITETKGSMKTRSTRLAIEMKSRGLKKNDIIMISSKTHAQQTIVWIAGLFIGAIICPLCPEWSFKECVKLMKKIKPKMCFCDSRTVSQIERILLTLKITSEVVNFGNETAGTTHFSKLFPFKEDSNFKPYFVEHVDKTVAFIMPTQGTTGDPKLVCVSHHNVYLQTFNLMQIFDNPSKVISFLPLSWITQTIFACTSIEYGVTRIMAPCFNERTACKMIHDFVIDHAILGTELALRLIGHVAVKDYNIACLKCILVGVVNTSLEDMMQMRKALPNVKFLQSYVLTETGIIAGVPASEYEHEDLDLVSITDLEQKWGKEKKGVQETYKAKPFKEFCHPVTKKKKLVLDVSEDLNKENFAFLSAGVGDSALSKFLGRSLTENTSTPRTALQKPTSVGRLLKNSRIKIVDTETHLPLGPNRTGELYFHGDGIMLGYFKDNTRTIASLERGYFKTADLAKYDEAGWIYLEGRIEDIIYFDQYTIIPKPLEEAFVSHPYVYDAVIIGSCSELIACIEKKTDNRLLTTEHLMAYFAKKQPDYHSLITSIIFFDEFPRTVAGTIKKRLLREQLLNLKVKLEYSRSLASITTANVSGNNFVKNSSSELAVSQNVNLKESKSDLNEK